MRLVDTTFLIDLLKQAPGVDAKALLLQKEGELFTTEINVYEVFYGVYAGDDVADDLEIVRRLIDAFTVLPLARRASLKAAEIAGVLHKRGQNIGDSDILTAGIALANGISTIVTRNIRHFERVPGLTVESY